MTPTVDESPRPWQRMLILGIAVLAVVHAAVIAMWLTPSSPVRDAVGQANLSTYVDPYFQQSWKSIDPQAQRVDETLQYRAQVLDVAAEKKSITPWFDLTGAEDRVMQSGFLRGGFEAARIHTASRRLATNLTAATYAFGKQRVLVEDDYIKQPVEQLGVDLRKKGQSGADVANYLAFDKMAVEFLSMYAAAKSGDEVLAIQYRVGRRVVPAYSDRETTKFEDIPFDFVTHGWRRGFTAQIDAQDAFDSYVGG